MAYAKVEVTVRLASASVTYLRYYRNECKFLPAKYQIFIGGMIFLRLFGILEFAIEELACKIATGALYKSGKHPKLLFPSKSIRGAQQNILNYGRTSPLSYPKWNQAYQVKKNMKNLMDPKDPFLVQISIHGATLKEMLRIRNHLVHRNAGTAIEYRKVVKAEYGGHTRIAPGPFLLSEKRTPIAKLDVYLALIPVMLDDLISG